jgi:uncharacterized integral membrane protein (TIGR00698 family)
VAALSVAIVPLTPLRVLGPLTVALLLGMALRPTHILRAAPRSSVVWLSREVLRAGVVLVGARLDWVLLARAGAAPIVVALTAVAVGMVLFAALRRILGVPHRLGALLAVGSSVCGAAAITAARPVIGASDDEANTGVAIVSVLGALGSVVLVAGHAMGWISQDAYALVAGGALHEVAHVMAAATAVPSVVPLATVTKLARVALLPIALIVLPWMTRGEVGGRRVPFRLPGLVKGFLVVSVVATIVAHTESVSAVWSAASKAIWLLATLMLASSMVAIGFLVDWASLRHSGTRPIIMALAGAVLLGGVVLATASLCTSP